MNHRQFPLAYEYKRGPSMAAPTLVLCHPHTLHGGSMQNKVIQQLFVRAHEHGFSAIRFDFRGAGKSLGQYDSGQGEREDLAQIIKYAQSNLGLGRYMCVGYSFGAYVVQGAQLLPWFDAMASVLIAPPAGMFDMHWQTPRVQKVFAASEDKIIPIAATKTWHASLEKSSLEIIDKANHYFVGRTSFLIQRVFAYCKEIV